MLLLVGEMAAEKRRVRALMMPVPPGETAEEPEVVTGAGRLAPAAVVLSPEDSVELRSGFVMK